MSIVISRILKHCIAIVSLFRKKKENVYAHYWQNRLLTHTECMHRSVERYYWPKLNPGKPTIRSIECASASKHHENLRVSMISKRFRGGNSEMRVVNGTVPQSSFVSYPLADTMFRWLRPSCGKKRTFYLFTFYFIVLLFIERFTATKLLFNYRFTTYYKEGDLISSIRALKCQRLIHDRALQKSF